MAGTHPWIFEAGSLIGHALALAHVSLAFDLVPRPILDINIILKYDFADNADAVPPPSNHPVSLSHSYSTLII